MAGGKKRRTENPNGDTPMVDFIPKRLVSNKQNNNSYSSSLLDFMKELYDILTNQEKYENRILAIETESYIEYLADNGGQRNRKYSDLDLVLLRSDLERTKRQKIRIKDGIAKRKDAMKNFNYDWEKNELDVTVYLIRSIEKRLESVTIDRKKIHTKIREIQESRSSRNTSDYGKNIYEQVVKSVSLVI